MNDFKGADQGAWVRRLIEDFIDSPENSMGNIYGDKVFDRPIVGFARGDDPIFEEFKRDIGSFYMTPLEVFRSIDPRSGVGPEELTVISWVLPHIKKTKLDNSREEALPSERWARGKKFGILVNVKLQKYLIAMLEGAGYRATAPCDPSHWSEQISASRGHASTWSERHAAYAAGLGTFGLCDGLITPVGKAMRCGSLVARITVAPTDRPYQSHTEYCLFLSGGTCGLCIKRCPVGAITEKGHDKEKCRLRCEGICTDYVKERYNLDTNVCGLCQTRVPCESRIPAKARARP